VTTIDGAQPLFQGVTVSERQPTRPRREGTREASFEGYVVARGADLLRTAYMLTGDYQRAEDLVQTALAKVWPRWQRLVDGGDLPHAYVRRVLVTSYIAWWRRRWGGEVPTAELPELVVPDPMLGVEEREVLFAALGRLPRGQRAVVVLRYFDDLTEAQTAQVLGCSVGTVKSQCSRALTALRASPLLREGGVTS
jgi:RNA polymerase sigma-70 factor (sigma-E family)